MHDIYCTLIYTCRRQALHINIHMFRTNVTHNHVNVIVIVGVATAIAREDDIFLNGRK